MDEKLHSQYFNKKQLEVINDLISKINTYNFYYGCEVSYTFDNNIGKGDIHVNMVENKIK